jgi:predicted RNase H-like HicB family nuclease
MSRNVLIFTGLVVREGSGYYSLCPELDVASQGETVSEAKAMLRDAVTGYLEACFESNLPYLRPVPVSDLPQHADVTFSLKVDLSVRVHA